MIVKLPFGDDLLALDLRGFRVRALAPSAPPSRDARVLAATALDAPLAGPPLVDIARGSTSATVVVPDATRKAELPAVLPVVIDRLRWAGIAESAITVLVANGTHPAVGADRLVSLLGELPTGLRVVQHDCRADELVTVGELRPGIPLRLHPATVGCECLITVGTVRHHYFAGFGGGPKMVFPGVGGYQEIQANHGLVLDLSVRPATRHPSCEPGIVVGNPVAEEIRRAAGHRPPDLALCLVEGREGGIAWAGAGAWDAAFEAAVGRVREWFEAPPEPRCDLMVAASGGAPTDSTLIQAHKALDAACRFLEPGGELLWVASLDDGLGSEEMAPFVEDPRPEAILERLAERWVQYGHTTLRLVEKASRYRIALHSRLDQMISRRLGFDAVADPESVVTSWRERNSGARVGVMVSGIVYPRST